MESELKIKPQGWIESMIFEKGLVSCGTANNGIGVYITKHGKTAPGGVISNEDAKTLADEIYKHLDQLQTDENQSRE